MLHIGCVIANVDTTKIKLLYISKHTTFFASKDIPESLANLIFFPDQLSDFIFLFFLYIPYFHI